MAVSGPRAGLKQILYFGTGTATPVSEGTGFSLNITTQFADDTSWGDTFQTQIPTILQAQGQITKHYDHAETSLRQAAINQTAGKYYWYPDRDDTASYVYGNCFIGGGSINAGSLTGIIGHTYDMSLKDQPTWVG